MTKKFLITQLTKKTDRNKIFAPEKTSDYFNMDYQV